MPWSVRSRIELATALPDGDDRRLEVLKVGRDLAAAYGLSASCRAIDALRS